VRFGDFGVFALWPVALGGDTSLQAAILPGKFPVLVESNSRLWKKEGEKKGN